MRSTDFDLHDRLIIVHAVFASLATLFTVPFAILCVRFLRPTSRRWFPIHATLQALTVLFLIIVFTLGTTTVALPGRGTNFEGPTSNRHHRLGLAIFIVVLVQSILGVAAHSTSGRPNAADAQAVTIAKRTRVRRRHPLRAMHILLGLSLAAMLYTQLYFGFIEWDRESHNKSRTPRGVKIVFSILFAAEVTAYVGGFVYEHVLRRRVMENATTDGEGDKRNMAKNRASERTSLLG